ncbi:LOW QUALITY PROTEIN: inositol 1,4,5-trisphosphate receptor-interacting protein-like 1 [Onychostruthus taczanowskii]|uniref:LOW QUALITY PROTEIN: inositol 1,4,5-trisphosphate receptor-interacting protein-like 1 n=1 Tax=Onychostruthus taczanowskii TaxID=356909 RepID=UPI001B8094CF|nr:LOW QUALITY PROTEIN: inositol 1,4,5-trisphosphate receptor-interacting protein-like 1 [Onychostruthus taczanowskii]
MPRECRAPKPCPAFTVLVLLGARVTSKKSSPWKSTGGAGCQPGLIQYPQQARNGLDEATLECMQQHAEYLSQQMTQLIQELEQMKLEQSDKGGQKERSSSNLVEDEEGCSIVEKVEEDKNDGNEEGSNVDATAESNAGNEAKEGYETAKEEVNQDENGEEANAARNDEDNDEKANGENNDHNVKRKLGSPLEESIQLPDLDLDKGCSLITDMMDKLIHIFGQGLSNSFYPVPQQAFGVGSAFEGWSPQALCCTYVVYCVLLPLSPPPGHAFHLELDTAGMLQRNFCVCVELLCTCMRERLGEDMLSFLHHPKEELRRKQEPSLLHTLCTSSYLDVEKTVQCFYGFVRVAWLLLPQSRHWRLMLQPCSRSCKFQLRNDQESFTAEMVFGVRQGDSDIFVGSAPTEVGIPSTTWLESYAVAEAKFFRHVSRQAPQGSCYCKCLQLLTGFLMSVGFSRYALKTVVMHLLSTVPLTRWCRRDFGQRLMDILKYLRCSLETKELHHFVFSSDSFLMEISLPSGFRAAEAHSLFEHLASSPDAHRKAVQEYNRLLHRLQQLLILAIERDAGAQSCACEASWQTLYILTSRS